jgi:pullulanase
VGFWATEYRVDGFRFDVMALIDIETMKLVRKELSRIDPRIIVYGEPWTAGKTPLKRRSDKRRTAGTGIGAFNDTFRDAIKGDYNGGAPGFIQTGDRADDVRAGLSGVTRPWPCAPVDAVNYIECHDNLTAWDKLRQTNPHTPVAVREQMSRLAALILLTSQGTLLIHAGQEFCRSKRGCNNSYDRPDAINRINWALKRNHADLCAYYRGLIALRKAHPALRLTDPRQVRTRVSFPAPPADRCIVYRINGRRLQGEPARWLLVLLNGESSDTKFTLPRGRWRIHADASSASLAPLGEVEKQLMLPPHSGMLLAR